MIYKVKEMRHHLLCPWCNKRLPAQLGFDLVTKAGFAFKPTKEHTAYWTIVATMTQNSIYECNEMLRSMNIRELAKEQ